MSAFDYGNVGKLEDMRKPKENIPWQEIWLDKEFHVVDTVQDREKGYYEENHVLK